MRAIWKGTISFGLVNIPISLGSGIEREELKFRLLRDPDLSPVSYKRVAEADGKEVPWDQIVKGYEYEKGKFVILKEEDFKRVDIEATQSVDIMNFVDLNELDRLLFYKPYFMEPGKGGDRAYALLRDSLKESAKIGIAKVVIRKRQHLAAVEPQGDALLLHLLYFPDEIRSVDEIKTPSQPDTSAAEKKMAKQLIDGMTEPWQPDKYNDEYQDALQKVIDEKIKKGGSAAPTAKASSRPTNVVDLVSVLQQSIDEAGKGSGTRKRTSSSKSTQSSNGRSRSTKAKSASSKPRAKSTTKRSSSRSTRSSTGRSSRKKAA